MALIRVSFETTNRNIAMAKALAHCDKQFGIKNDKGRSVWDGKWKETLADLGRWNIEKCFEKRQFLTAYLFEGTGV